MHKLAGNVERMAKLVKVRVEIAVFDVDFADGRTDGPDAQTGILQLAANLARLIEGNDGYIFTVHTADFKSVQSVALHCGNLFVDGWGCFVGKGIDFHGSFLLVGITVSASGQTVRLARFCR